MDTETIENEKNILIRKQKSKKVFFEQKGEESRLDCIYDNSPLGFEKPMSSGLKNMEPQDPLEEINLGTEENQKPTYVRKLVDTRLRENIVFLLQEVKYCFLCSDVWYCSKVLINVCNS